MAPSHAHGRTISRSCIRSDRIPGENTFPAREAESHHWALFDLSGKLLKELSSRWDEVGLESEELRAFRLGPYWGIATSQGEVVIEPRLTRPAAYSRGTRLMHFVGGEAAVLIAAGAPRGMYDTLWLGVVAQDGNWIVEPAPNFGGYGDGSLIWFPIAGPEDDPPWGIDVRPLGRRLGPEVRVPFSTADDLYAFQNGSAPFAVDVRRNVERSSQSYFPTLPVAGSKQWGLLDGQGSIIIPAEYDAVFSFTEGLAPARVGGLWGFVDPQGAMRITPQFRDVESFRDGCAACCSAAGKWGVIDQAGDWILAPSYDAMFSEQTLPI